MPDDSVGGKIRFEAHTQSKDLQTFKEFISTYVTYGNEK